jgi:U3 small nucleolar RNA-associated protein 22
MSEPPPPPAAAAAAAAAANGGTAKGCKHKGKGSKAGSISTSSSSTVLAPAKLTRRSICVGVLVDPVQVLRLVDVGPAADDVKAAAKWQALWGSKSELRRFQDGRICEVVAWEVPPDCRHTIPDLAVTYLLGRHLPPGTTVNGCAGVFDQVLQPQRGVSDIAAGRAAAAAFDKLSKQLRALSDVALKVVGVQPLSAVTRHTPGFYPQPHPLAGGSLGALQEGGEVPRCVEPLEVLVQLEGSGGCGAGVGGTAGVCGCAHATSIPPACVSGRSPHGVV